MKLDGIFNRTNLIRTSFIMILIVMWIFFSNIELSLSNSLSRIRDDDIIIDNDLNFEEDYKQVRKYDDVRMIRIGQVSWNQFHEIIEYADISNDPNATDKNNKECKKLHEFIELFGEFYPNCDQNDNNIFRKIVETNPIPTCSNKFLIKLWGCHIHNKMNKILDKDDFNCLKLFSEEELSSNDVKFNKVTLSKEEKQMG